MAAAAQEEKQKTVVQISHKTGWGRGAKEFMASCMGLGGFRWRLFCTVAP